MVIGKKGRHRQRAGQGALVTRHVTTGKVAKPRREHSSLRFNPRKPAPDLRAECRGLRFRGRDQHRLQTNSERFALRVTGDSMIGKHILDGDFVVMEHGPELRNGQIVATD